MADIKILGPGGKPIPMPRKGEPLPQMPLGGATIVAQIEQFGNGQFGIRRLSAMSSLDLAKVCANLAASIIQVEQNKNKVVPAAEGTDEPPEKTGS